MPKYRKKPVVIDAIQFTNDTETIIRVVEWVEDLDMSTSMIGMNATVINIREHGYFIDTLEGKMKVDFNDYVIKGIAGEFYPCKPEIFEQTYEKVDTE
ncbi:MAG: hypothetical protein RR651_11810 [Lysinibacillus sp.]